MSEEAKQRAEHTQSLKDVGNIRNLTLKEEFYEKIEGLFDQVGMYKGAKIFEVDEANLTELWSWTEQKIQQVDQKQGNKPKSVGKTIHDK